MPDRPNTPDSTPDAAHLSRKSAKSSLSNQLQEFLKARSELFGLEAKEASLIVARKVVLAIMALGAALLTYLLFLIGVAWIINHFLARTLPENLTIWSIPATALILALLHLGAAALFGRKAKMQGGPPLFEFTRREWQKDRAWLSKKTSRKENEN